jgi:hypothetical protein
MNEKRITIGLIVAGVITAIIISMVGTIFGYLFFEKPWLRYTNIPFPVLETYGYPGKIMPVHVVRCNDDNVPHIYTITRTLERVVQRVEPKDYMVMPDVTVQILPGCSEADAVIHIIPVSTRPGTWRLIGVSEIRGVLVSHLVEWRSVPFTVLATPPPVAIPPVVIIQGAPGPAGPAGKSGKRGTDGSDGTNGHNGSNVKNFWGK